jgi:hypothetical protein
MTNIHDHQSLSNLQLLVLARLSGKKGAKAEEVAAAMAAVAPPDAPRSARELADEALDVLRQRSLVTTRSPSNAQRPSLELTVQGRDALRAAFGIDTEPGWTALRDRYLPALALGIPVTSAQVSDFGKTDKLTVAVLLQHFSITQASTVIRLCDALIAKELGFTGPVTLPRLRAHVLAREVGLESKVTSTKELEPFATRVASKTQDNNGDGKRPLRQALIRRWVYRVNSAPEVVPGPRLVAVPSKQAPLPLQSRPLAQHAASPPLGTAPSPLAPPRSPGPAATPADMLLTLVRETIPRIGADGRFGDEKVFVSAIWQHLEDDGRLADWSLDRFKRWLVIANRDQLLDLARADAQGDMDSRLVEESEIVDRGATFHFVVDRQALGTGRGLHAR